jgi:hypothetical protein
MSILIGLREWAGADIGTELLNYLPPEAHQPLDEAVEWIEGNLFYRRISSGGAWDSSHRPEC